MAEVSLFTHPFLVNIILPFLLIFVVIYAILEKTSVLGEGKRYANLIVAIVIGFIFIGVQEAVGFTLKLIPIVSVLIIVLLCYFLIFGFIDIHLKKGMKIVLGIVFGIALIGAILWATGLLEKIATTTISVEVISMIIMLLIVGGAIALIISTKPKK